MGVIETTPELVQRVYQKSRENIEKMRKKVNRPMNLTEKILFGHLVDMGTQELERGRSFLQLFPDRVAMQDATAQMAVLQFMLAGKDEAAVPSTIHCDHLIRARTGVKEDMKVAISENEEVFNFLATAASRYNLGFWKPGAGIIHQVILENYAFPGGLMIGTDSHTPNAGGLGMLAIGVGGADAADVMSGLSWEVKNPKIVGVHLKGKMSGWTSSKDVILKLLEILTCKGGTDKIIEYFGEGSESISCTGKATITNMGAELGATCSVFPYDERMYAYLKVTERGELADIAKANADILKADPDIFKNPAKYYDEVIEIDLSRLEPYLVGPHSPDVARPISKIKEEAKANGWNMKLSAALIGSCTNSSYEDIGRSVNIAKQALAAGIKMPQQFYVSPGSAQIYHTIERDGHLKTLLDVGAVVLANACGPCIGQWQRDDLKKNEINTIVTSFNRNFRGRNDGNHETLSFIGGPELVMAVGLAGQLDFNPITDSLDTPDGKKIKLTPPEAPELPANGFVRDSEGYQKPEGRGVAVQVAPQSNRLQLLTPFKAWDGEDFKNLTVLAKLKGKCTTDHISPAGKWLKFRGHLDNISDNLLEGATNAFTGEIGKGTDISNGDQNVPYSKVARNYKKQGREWVIIGDENYGEGSSREHAAMSPRHLGCLVVIAKSFARIHETNLKKQGVLALRFGRPQDFDRILEEDRISIMGLAGIEPSRALQMIITHKDGAEEKIEMVHSFNNEQIKWFKAGSALNLIRAKK
ncbi:MAG: aconitate hydratase [Pseudomonadota bacterium]|nr:aconitate hydratase [Pseudomonadota bacterium]